MEHYTEEDIIKILNYLLDDNWQSGDEKRMWETDEGDITSKQLFEKYIKPILKK